MTPRRRAAAVLAAGALAALTGCSGIPFDFLNGSFPSAAEEDAALVEEAKEVLPEIDVKGRAPKTGYDRDEFGQRWADIDRNGCDQRNDVLTRDLTDVTYVDPASCAVATGTLEDRFTGTTIDFTRGAKTSSQVQIDHVVSVPARL